MNNCEDNSHWFANKKRVFKATTLFSLLLIFGVGEGGVGVERTIKMPISTEGSDTPTTRPKTGSPV